MLAWLKRLIGAAPAPAPYDDTDEDEEFGLFTLEERLLYRYFNGKEVLAVDPMILYRKLMEVGPSLDADIALANSPSKDRTKGYAEMVKKVRSIFDVKTYEEGGLTEAECSLLLDHFFTFLGWSKKKRSERLTSSASGPPSPPTSSPAAESATASSGDSGSTDAAPATAPPESSPSASA